MNFKYFVIESVGCVTYLICHWYSVCVGGDAVSSPDGIDNIRKNLEVLRTGLEVTCIDICD